MFIYKIPVFLILKKQLHVVTTCKVITWEYVIICFNDNC